MLTCLYWRPFCSYGSQSVLQFYLWFSGLAAWAVHRQWLMQLFLWVLSCPLRNSVVNVHFTGCGGALVSYLMWRVFCVCLQFSKHLSLWCHLFGSLSYFCWCIYHIQRCFISAVADTQYQEITLTSLKIELLLIAWLRQVFYWNLSLESFKMYFCTTVLVHVDVKNNTTRKLIAFFCILLSAESCSQTVTSVITTVMVRLDSVIPC